MTEIGVPSALGGAEYDHRSVGGVDAQPHLGVEHAQQVLEVPLPRRREERVDDEVWQAAAEHFDESRLSAIVLNVALTNFFNRVNRAVRAQAGTTW